MKTVIVTGASKGIGLGIATRLVDSDYQVVCISRTLSEDLEKLIERSDGRVSFSQFDLAETDGIADLTRDICAKHGKIWGLVNNAGVGLDGFLGTFHESEINKMLAINLTAPILLTKYISRRMLARAEGRIINISSIIATTGFSGLSVYAASKSGLEGFTRSASRELGRRKITINCVAPGFVETEMNAGMSEQAFASVRRRAPLGLPGTEDIASMVHYLLAEESGMITGQSFIVDGGSTA